MGNRAFDCFELINDRQYVNCVIDSEMGAINDIHLIVMDCELGSAADCDSVNSVDWEEHAVSGGPWDVTCSGLMDAPYGLDPVLNNRYVSGTAINVGFDSWTKRGQDACGSGVEFVDCNVVESEKSPIRWGEINADWGW